MRNFLNSIRFFSLLILLTLTSPVLNGQVDTNLTAKTKALFNNLKKVEASNSFLFGQEFFNSFRYSSGSAHGDETESDAKDITGSHPAVLGSDFHYYLEKNATERGYHTDAVKWAFQQGYVITFDWHISARGTSTYEYNPNMNTSLVANIVNAADASGDRAWFFGELDKVIQIMNVDLKVGSDTIPIVFRPWHEMNGAWFWWGSSGASEANYKLLYQQTVDYIKERTKTVLFCWSPNASFNSARYPGDAYVDVVGVDLYEATTTSLQSELGKVVDFAQAHSKIAVFSETGNRNAGVDSPLYWSNVVLPGILNDPTGKSKKIAWVLTWINASWSVPYVAHSTSSSAVKSSFNNFKKSPNAVFGSEVKGIYGTLGVKGVTLPDDFDMNLGATFQLTADVQPEFADNRNVTWESGDPEIVSVDEDGLLTAHAEGTAGITVTSVDGNFSTSVIVNVLVPVAAENDQADDTLQVFPNPAGDKLTIKVADFSRASSIQIYNSTGKLMHSVDNFDKEVTLHTKELLAPGFYIIKAVDGKTIATKKVVIK